MRERIGMRDAPLAVVGRNNGGTWGVLVVCVNPSGQLIDQWLSAEQAAALGDELHAMARLVSTPGQYEGGADDHGGAP